MQFGLFLALGVFAATLVGLGVRGDGTKDGPEECRAEGAVFVVDVGRPRCDGQGRGWVCVGGAGARFWTNGGVFLVVTMTRCRAFAS